MSSNDRPAGGEFLQLLDSIVVSIRTTLGFMLLAAIIIVVGPFMLLRGCAQRFARDDVYVYELNPHVIEHAEAVREKWDQEHPAGPFKDAPFPFRWDYSVREWQGAWPDHEPHNCYAKFHTVAEAEDWLLANGYKVRKFRVEPIDDARPSEGFQDADYFKTMPAKGPPNSRDESIAMIGIDYGDSYLHDIFYEYADGKAPFDYGRFQREDVDPNRQYEQAGFALKGSYDTLHASIWSWLDFEYLRTGRLSRQAGHDLVRLRD